MVTGFKIPMSRINRRDVQYFYNVVNSSYKDHQQFSYREMSKIERSEIDINTYLGTK